MYIICDNTLIIKKSGCYETVLWREVRIWSDSNEALIPASNMMSPTSLLSPSTESRMKKFPSFRNVFIEFSGNHRHSLPLHWLLNHRMIEPLPNVPLLADLHPNHQ